MYLVNCRGYYNAKGQLRQTVCADFLDNGKIYQYDWSKMIKKDEFDPIIKII